MKKEYFIKTVCTCIRDGNVCKKGEVKTFIEGKFGTTEVTHTRSMEDCITIQHIRGGFSSLKSALNLIERYIRDDAYLAKKYEPQWKNEYIIVPVDVEDN